MLCLYCHPPFAFAVAARNARKLPCPDVNHSRPTATTRLRRSDPSAPGYTRVRVAGGFAYQDSNGSTITDSGTIVRIRALVIPPAWRDVWICPDPRGHLQATGVDAAGRRQYLYHELWREQQGHLKFQHMEHFARALPEMRKSVLATMGHGRELDRERVLACAVRLLDVGMFRIGSDVYEKEDGHLGLSTIAKGNVSITADGVLFDYLAKEGVRQVHLVQDPPCVEIVSALKRRRGGGTHLLAFRERGAWHRVHAHLINEHLKTLIGDSFSAKDFRTWNGTLLAAVSVAMNGGEARSDRARRRVIAQAASDVANVLGNTPAVARSSYIDPRVFERFLTGLTIAGALEEISAQGLEEERRRAEVERAALELLA
jgi:DNA topoisomerase I